MIAPRMRPLTGDEGNAFNDPYSLLTQANKVLLRTRLPNAPQMFLSNMTSDVAVAFHALADSKMLVPLRNRFMGSQPLAVTDLYEDENDKPAKRQRCRSEIKRRTNS